MKDLSYSLLKISGIVKELQSLKQHRIERVGKLCDKLIQHWRQKFAPDKKKKVPELPTTSAVSHAQQLAKSRKLVKRKFSQLSPSLEQQPQPKKLKMKTVQGTKQMGAKLTPPSSAKVEKTVPVKPKHVEVKTDETRNEKGKFNAWHLS